uniref:Uncharacterized protein n=1 Tax=Sinocyclocheilus rhinocerous TaxID=307959 RepID=A0A673G8I0_9TELE
IHKKYFKQLVKVHVASYDSFKTSNGNDCLFLNLSCLFISYSPFVFSVSVCFHICSQFICLVQYVSVVTICVKESTVYCQ